ncbi:MAG TPA: amino acid permease [Verrucomicrobiales bacterium]|nr:amino acid permease [Verrucomicrobiales bacterium]
MSNMIGVGPFLTIPLLLSCMGGPQAMLGWAVAMLITIPDGMVWSELGASLPGSGGSYVYLREGFGRRTWGSLMAFLFIWQFAISGPLEIASGYIGFDNYLGYLWPHTHPLLTPLVTTLLGVGTIWLLYRRIGSVARLTITLWIGTLVTVAGVIVTGILHFDPRVAFDFPPGALELGKGFWTGLGAASVIGVYDYLGYYDICFMGDEVRNPGTTIPRSVLLSLVGVAVIYVLINLSIIGIIPWREFVPAEEKPQVANFVVSILMERIYGPKVAAGFTLLILWTTLGSVFALLLGYSRIPYAAALDGGFFSLFKRVHPRGHFPHVSLVVVGGVAILCSFYPLQAVIDALVTLRIIVLFIGQIVAVHLLRQRAPGMSRPYRIWLYPLPSLVALAGWLFLFVTSPWKSILLGLGTLAVGGMIFLLWTRHTRRWPWVGAAGQG